VAIEMASIAFTSARRIATTRPSISSGVRCWNIVWLGTTKATLATPTTAAVQARPRGYGHREKQARPEDVNPATIAALGTREAMAPMTTPPPRSPRPFETSKNP